jgi:hypothetical protein
LTLYEVETEVETALGTDGNRSKELARLRGPEVNDLSGDASRYTFNLQ